MAHRALGPGSLVASRFRLEDLLEESSGAEFWRATDLTLVRNVGIHVVDAGDLRAAAVLTAARTSATVSDGRILRVLDAVHDGGFVHVVHEWGVGVSLDRMLADDALDPRRAAWLVREVAEAITVAHRHGVAHGRLLPENVLLTDAGAVKLIGFVVDAVLHRRDPATPGVPPSEHESDVTNLGALLYACLTGKWPGHPGSRLPDAPRDHERYCRPRQVRPGVPRQLDALCDQLVNDDARGRGRVETAAEVVAVLGDYLGDGITTAVPVTSPTTFLDSVVDPVPDSLLDAPLDPGATQAALPTFADSEPEDDARRVPSAASVTGATGAAGRRGAPGRAGALPESWGPDRVDDTGSRPAVVEPPPGGSWLRLAAVVGVLVLLLLAVAVGFQLGRPDPGDEAGEPGPTGSASAGPGPVLPIAAASDFDPEQDGGTPEENPDLVPLAVDGDPATAWETLSYEGGPVLAPYKSGVGLLLDLGSEQPVAAVEVRLGGGPYDVQLLAAPPETGAPTSTEGLDVVDTARGATNRAVLESADAAPTRYLVVWLTALPVGEGGYRGQIAEVVVRS